MKVMDNIPVWGEHEEKTLAQIRTCAATADRAALMADGHLGYAVPIGGVVAYKDAISPSGVGFDIACGNKAVRLDMPGEELRANISKIMDDVWSTLSFGVGVRMLNAWSTASLTATMRAGKLRLRARFARKH